MRPLKGHRWGTAHKRCPARAWRANVPPLALLAWVYFVYHVYFGLLLSAHWAVQGTDGLSDTMGRPSAKQIKFSNNLQMHQNVVEANLVPIDGGWNGYIAQPSPSPQPQAKPQHTRISWGGGAQKRKKSPQGTYCTVQRGGVCKSSESNNNELPVLFDVGIISNARCRHAAGAPQGALQTPQGCSPQSPLTETAASVNTPNSQMAGYVSQANPFPGSSAWAPARYLAGMSPLDSQRPQF